MTKMRLSIVVAASMLAAAAVPAWAQITTGTVSGTVKDPTGGIIPGATVAATSHTEFRRPQDGSLTP